MDNGKTTEVVRKRWCASKHDIMENPVCEIKDEVRKEKRKFVNKMESKSLLFFLFFFKKAYGGLS